MRIDENIVQALLRLQEQYGSFYEVARLTGRPGDRVTIHQSIRNYQDWQSGKRKSQPQFGDDVWERLWKVLKPYLSADYAPMVFRKVEPATPVNPGIINILSQDRMDEMMVTLEDAKNPQSIKPNDMFRKEKVDPGISFGFEAGGQKMEGYGIEDGDTILCGPAASAMDAEPCSLVACRYDGRCLVRIFDRHDDIITLISTNAKPLLIKANASDIEWMAPVCDVKMELQLRVMRKYIPQGVQKAVRVLVKKASLLIMLLFLLLGQVNR